MSVMRLYAGFALMSLGALLIILPFSGVFLSVSALGGTGEILVVDISDKPISGALITFTSVELYGNSYPIGLAIGYTEADGIRDFSVSNIGKFTYEVEKSGYERNVGTIEISLGQHSYAKTTLIASESSTGPTLPETPSDDIEIITGSALRGVIMAACGVVTSASGLFLIATCHNPCRWGR